MKKIGSMFCEIIIKIILLGLGPRTVFLLIFRHLHIKKSGILFNLISCRYLLMLLNTCNLNWLATVLPLFLLSWNSLSSLASSEKTVHKYVNSLKLHQVQTTSSFDSPTSMTLPTLSHATLKQSMTLCNSSSA